MRTDRYRLVVRKDQQAPEREPLYVELYDHQTDPAETRNIVDQNPGLVSKLLAQFEAGWQGSLPSRRL